MAEQLTDCRQLNVWQKAHKLVLDTYDLSKKFPKEERAELVSHMRYAATSIPIKIAEGFMRRSPKEKEVSYKATQQFLEELRYYIILSQDLDYIKDNTEILNSVNEIGRMLTGLVRSTRNKPESQYY